VWALEGEDGEGLSALSFPSCFSLHFDYGRVGKSRADISRWVCGVAGLADKGGEEEKCAKCKITVFSKPQLRVKMKWVYHLST
jgi:hypothetical protein